MQRDRRSQRCSKLSQVLKGFFEDYKKTMLMILGNLEGSNYFPNNLNRVFSLTIHDRLLVTKRCQRSAGKASLVSEPANLTHYGLTYGGICILLLTNETCRTWTRHYRDQVLPKILRRIGRYIQTYICLSAPHHLEAISGLVKVVWHTFWDF